MGWLGIRDRSEAAPGPGAPRPRPRFKVPTIVALGLVFGTLAWAAVVLCVGPLTTGWRWTLFGLGWPLLPTVVLFASAGAVLRGATGLEARWSRGELARYLAGSALAATLVPGLSLALLGFAYEESRRGGSISLVILAALGWLAAVLASWGAVREMRVPGVIVPFPEGPCRDEAFRLARRIGVPLRLLFLAQTRRARIAGAYALGRTRVAVSDALVAALSPVELQAVLSHEFQHLAQQSETARLVLIGSASTLVTALSAEVAGRGLPGELRHAASGAAALLVFAMFLRVLVRLKRRQEDEADEAAVAHVGAAPLISAIAKVAALNGSKVDRATTRYRSLADRATRIGRLGGLAPAQVERILLRIRMSTDFSTPAGGGLQTCETTPSLHGSMRCKPD